MNTIQHPEALVNRQNSVAKDVGAVPGGGGLDAVCVLSLIHI